MLNLVTKFLKPNCFSFFKFYKLKSMNHLSKIHLEKQFVATRALPCPYIPGRTERKLVTDLVAKKRHGVL